MVKLTRKLTTKAAPTLEPGAIPPVWNYDPATGKLVSMGYADKNPLFHPESGENDEFLFPGSSTTLPPPEPVEGKEALFLQGAWYLVGVEDQKSIDELESAAPDDLFGGPTIRDVFNDG